MASLLDRMRPRHRLSDGYTYLKITRPLDRRLRVELDKDAENVHVFDTSPAVQDLDWLLPWRENLRRLLVLDFSITSVDAVNEFVALEALSLSPSTQVRGHIDADSLHNLRELVIDGYVDFALGGSRLERLVVQSARARTVSEIENHQTLTELQLHAPKRLPKRVPASLRTLRVSGSTLRDSHPVDGLGNLRELTLTGVRGIRDLSLFEGARRLEVLHVEDCVDLVSTQGPGLAPGAVTRLVGSTPARQR